jgi:uncharacterized protein
MTTQATLGEQPELSNHLASLYALYGGQPIAPAVDARLIRKETSRGWMTTFTGKKIWPLNARPWDICIEDIAHALSRKCRFSGHCLDFYSVAQHCVLVSRMCSQENKLWALMHDAAEAYLDDLPRPVKYSPELTGYREAERKLEQIIWQVFGLDRYSSFRSTAWDAIKDLPDEVVVADQRLLYTEMYSQLPAGSLADAIPEYILERLQSDDAAGKFEPISGWSPIVAEAAFFQMYEELRIV